MVATLGFHSFSGIITPKNVLWTRSQSAKPVSFFFSSRINACREKKLSSIWATVYDGNKEINISMLMQTCWGEVLIDRPVRQLLSVDLITRMCFWLVLHGVRCQGSSVLNCWDSTFHCPQGTTLNQVENVIQHTSEWKTKMNIMGCYQNVIIEH